MNNKSIAILGLCFIGWFVYSRKKEADYINDEFDRMYFTDTGLFSDYGYKPNLVTQDYSWVWDGSEYIKKKRT